MILNKSNATLMFLFCLPQLSQSSTNSVFSSSVLSLIHLCKHDATPTEPRLASTSGPDVHGCLLCIHIEYAKIISPHFALIVCQISSQFWCWEDLLQIKACRKHFRPVMPLVVIILKYLLPSPCKVFVLFQCHL